MKRAKGSCYICCKTNNLTLVSTFDFKMDINLCSKHFMFYKNIGIIHYFKEMKVYYTYPNIKI